MKSGFTKRSLLFLCFPLHFLCVFGFLPKQYFPKLSLSSSPITTNSNLKLEVLSSPPKVQFDSSSSIQPPMGIRIEANERIQKLRDLCLQKEILKDLTASEFAIRLEVKRENSKIDYDMLISNLDQDINLLKLQKHHRSKPLLDRVIATKDDLIRIKNGETSIYLEQRVAEAENVTSNENDDTTSPVVVSSLSTTTPATTTTALPTTTTTTTLSSSSSLPKTDIVSVQELRESLKLIVREDGTVDWEGALASSKEVAKFGSELWERINGKEEGLPSFSELFGQMQSKVIETTEVIRLTEIASIAQQELNEIKQQSYKLKVKLRELRKNGESIDANDIQTLQKFELQYKEIDKRVRLFTLNLDIERICVYLEQEIESSINSFDLRSLIAEVALIDKQLSNILAGIRLNITSTSAEVAQSMASAAAATSSYSYAPELISLIDDDELSVICNEVNALKGQLGLGPQPGGVMDWGSLGVLVTDTISKIKQGLGFYGEGTKILLNDIQYAWFLVLKAAQGYTLKPREVNSLRRAGKDVLTLIPFTIILIIPLTPIGHVLVFSFIQRFFPDFFPSCYTEKRLNLGKLLTEIERKDLDALLGTDDGDKEFNNNNNSGSGNSSRNNNSNNGGNHNNNNNSSGCNNFMSSTLNKLFTSSLFPKDSSSSSSLSQPQQQQQTGSSDNKTSSSSSSSVSGVAEILANIKKSVLGDTSDQSSAL